MTETGSTAGTGYSGTPLAKKVGIKPDHLVLLRHAPAGWNIPGLPAGATVSRRATAGGSGAASPTTSGVFPEGTVPPRAGRGRADTAPGSGVPDITIAFCRSRRQLERDLPVLIASLPAGGALWVAWPRRAAGHSSDITENGLRDALLPLGVVDVKVAALDHDWSGLKFVWRKKPRA